MSIVVLAYETVADLSLYTVATPMATPNLRGQTPLFPLNTKNLTLDVPDRRNAQRGGHPKAQLLRGPVDGRVRRIRH